MYLSADVVCGIVAMITLGLANVLSKPAIDEIGPVRTVLWRNIIMVALLVVIAPSIVNPSRLSTSYVLLAAAVGAFGYVPLYFFFRAVGKGKMGVVVPIANAESVVVVGIGVLVLGEQMTVNRALAITCTVVGLTMLTVNITDWKKSSVFKRDSGVPDALLAMLCWGIFFPVTQVPARHIGAMANALIIETMIMVVAVVHTVRLGGHFRYPTGNTHFTMTLSAFCGAAASIALNAGLELGYVSVMVPIVAASPVVSAAGAWLFFHERLRLVQYLAGTVTITGVIWIALATAKGPT